MSEDEHSMLARLDERIKGIKDDMDVIARKFTEYVRLERYRTIELLVFGVVGLILSGVFAAIIATVVHR
jgi:hypothetical protein